MVWKKKGGYGKPYKHQGMKKQKTKGEGEVRTQPTPRHTHTPCTRSFYWGCKRYDNDGMHRV